uniref:NADH dehydrogenase subunit 4L n=1 Tax=Leptorhynchoides thecatus TaxID=60532 RepID=Q5DNC0_LEPTH|nr:NADH dehydrogenase subunit 4L [Leptorhynchoides thecatus]AAT64937.1 NADH dehydrogenase subunit 4L [Leptorhynchoides thecatus]
MVILCLFILMSGVGLLSWLIGVEFFLLNFLVYFCLISSGEVGGFMFCILGLMIGVLMISVIMGIYVQGLRSCEGVDFFSLYNY